MDYIIHGTLGDFIDYNALIIYQARKAYAKQNAPMQVVASRGAQAKFGKVKQTNRGRSFHNDRQKQ